MNFKLSISTANQFHSASCLLHSPASRTRGFHFTIPLRDKGTRDKGAATCDCITRFSVWTYEPCDLLFCRTAAWGKKPTTSDKKERKKTLQEAADMCRTCCSLQTGACDRIATSSISCRPRAKHNSPVMITHGLLQITLRNPKNQGLQAGADRRERERASGASEEGSCADESGAEPVRTYLENSHSFNATPPPSSC